MSVHPHWNGLKPLPYTTVLTCVYPSSDYSPHPPSSGRRPGGYTQPAPVVDPAATPLHLPAFGQRGYPYPRCRPGGHGYPDLDRTPHIPSHFPPSSGRIFNFGVPTGTCYSPCRRSSGRIVASPIDFRHISDPAWEVWLWPQHFNRYDFICTVA